MRSKRLRQSNRRRAAWVSARSGRSTSVPPGLARCELCRGPRRDDRMAGGRRRPRPYPRSSERPGRKVDVLVVESTVAALAAKRATTTIPIVMAFVGDPVGSGIVRSLARPGGNITGLSNMTVELALKRLQLLKEAVPHAKRIGVLWNPDTPWHQRAVEQVQMAAPGMGVQLAIVSAQTKAELGPAFASFTRARVDALLIVDAPFVAIHGEPIFQMAAKARLPAAYARKYAVVAGRVDHLCSRHSSALPPRCRVCR